MFWEYFEVMKKVEEAYKPFQIMKKGSKTDKIINIILWILYFFASSYLFYSNIINNKYVHLVFSWICFLIIFSVLFLFVLHIHNRESFVYTRKASSEIKQMD